MVTYDAKLIREHADRMYRSASQTVVLYALGGIITGASVGLLSHDLKLTVMPAILVGILGYLMGKGKASKLKLEAQLALCHVQIEENTRGLDRRESSA